MQVNSNIPLTDTLLDKHGLINTKLFFQLLDLYKLKLNSKDQKYIRKNYTNGDKIKWK